jgi:hypothetical protein
MIECKMTWDGDKVLASLKGIAWERLQRCVQFYWQAVTLALNISAPPSSKPGEPAHKRTGFGQRNLLYELDQQAGTGKVGYGLNAKYMVWLELGTAGGKVVTPVVAKCLSWLNANGKRIFARRVVTRPLAARPALKLTLEKVMPQLRAIAGEDV